MDARSGAADAMSVDARLLPAERAWEAERARCDARLTALSKQALIETLVVALFDGRDAALKRIADEAPLPAWAMSNVLLSGDLLPNIFATLEFQHGSAAAVCLVWRDEWVSTSEQRRGLRLASLNQPSVDAERLHSMSAHPSGEWLAVLNELPEPRLGAQLREQVLIFDASMREMRRVAVPILVAGFCVSAERMYISCHEDQRILSYDVSTFDMVCEHHDDSDDAAGYEYDCMVVSDGVLFAATYISDEDESGVVAFDAVTLQGRQAVFGYDHLDGRVKAIVVAGSELFVTDRRPGRIQVYSTSSLVHLREIRGDWGSPNYLLYYDGRLYLASRANSARAELSIIVLTLDGQTLQTWQDQNYDNDSAWSMCLFGPRLIVNVRQVDRKLNRKWNRKLIALMGI